MKKILLLALILTGCSKEHICIKCTVGNQTLIDTCGYDIDHVYRIGNGVLVSDSVGVMSCEYVY